MVDVNKIPQVFEIQYAPTVLGVDWNTVCALVQSGRLTVFCAADHYLTTKEAVINCLRSYGGVC